MNTTTFIQILDYTYAVEEGIYFRGCTRCQGTGHYSFDGRDSICYLCKNNAEARLGVRVGSLEDAEKDATKRAKARAKREEAREQLRLAKLAKRDAAWQALKDSHPAVWEMLSKSLGVSIPWDPSQGTPEQEDSNNFVRSMASGLWRLDERPFTARQLEVLAEIAAKRQAPVSEEAPTEESVPEGRQVVTGTVISAKVVENEFGTSWKVTVQDDRGFRVYVSLAKSLVEEAREHFSEWAASNGYSPRAFEDGAWLLGVENYAGVVGRRVTFTATLERSRDVPGFGFGSRPTKASWLPLETQVALF